MTSLHDVAFKTLLMMQKTLLMMQKTVEDVDEDCLDPRCDECKAWRVLREAINELSEALAEKREEKK